MTRLAARIAWTCAVGSLLLAACSDTPPPAGPANFQRPNRVAFLCVSKARKVVVDLACCGGSDVRPNWCKAVDAEGVPDYDLHALVTQSGRGEVAAVNLDDDIVVDSRRDVPGYTFVPAGELPSAIVVPPRHSELTYVANFGSRDLHVLRSQAFLSLPPGETPVAQVVPIRDRDSTASPVDLLLSPDEDALFVAVPGLGGVLRMPLRRCNASDPTCPEGHVIEDEVAFIDLRGSQALAPATPPAPERAAPYEELCHFERPPPPDVVPMVADAAALVAPPRPVAFALDAFCRTGEPCSRRLLVADEALPLIHVIDIDAFGADGAAADALVEPIVTGVPTTDVAVTPHVPSALPDDGSETQFVYAIDATDGSVLVLEDGRLLSVDADPHGRADRLPVYSGRSSGGGSATAAALAVVTPGFDTTGPAAQHVTPARIDETRQCGDVDSELECRQCTSTQSKTEDACCGQGDARTWCLDCDFNPRVDPQLCVDCAHTRQDPRRLRGVFLTVALTDGTVRVVDVHDMEVRGAGAESCRTCTSVPIPVLVRHHARLAVNFQRDDPDYEPELTPVVAAVAVRVDGRGYVLRSDGTTNSPDLPGLTCFTCGEAGLVHVYPPPDAFADASVPAPTADAGVDAGEGGMPSLDGGIATDGGSVDASVQAFNRCPEDAPSLLCANPDPWFATDEEWTVTYEGALPGAQGGAGRLIEPDSPESRTGTFEFAADGIDFCARGVLGADVAAGVLGSDVAEADEPIGDQLVIVHAIVNENLLPTDRIEDCSALADTVNEDPGSVLSIRIRRAYADRLVLEGQTVERFDGRPVSTATLRTCLADTPIRFGVRAGGSYTVVGSRSKLSHRIVTSSSGRCEVATGEVTGGDATSHRTGRAYPGRRFDNGRIAFVPRVEEEDAPSPTLGADIAFSLLTPAQKLSFDARSVGFSGTPVLPTDLRYNDLDRRLYLVDIYGRGLVPISLDPFEERSNLGFR